MAIVLPLSGRFPVLVLLCLGFAQGSASIADETSKFVVVESMTTALIRYAEIASRDSGILQSIPVTPNEIVAEGTLLASLDDELQVIAVQQAELNVTIAELKANNDLPIETAKAKVREAEQEKARLEIAAKISQKQAESDVSVRLAEKNREVAQFELDRAQKAKSTFSGSISNAELNRLQVLFDQRTLEIEKAQEDRAITVMKPEADAAAVRQQAETVAGSQLLALEREQEKRVAQTSVDVANSELALARLHLNRRRLLAPFSSTIVALNRQPGEWVEPGTIVLRLIQLDRLRVEGFVNAGAAAQIRIGHAAEISFSDHSHASVKAVVSFVSPEIEAVNQQVRIWAEFDNADHRIRPGLVATMKINVSGPSANSSPKTLPKNASSSTSR